MYLKMYLLMSSCCLTLTFLGSAASPTFSYNDSTSENDTNNYNSTKTDLYVIRETIFEVGILTDASDEEDDDNSTDSYEQVNFSFYNPERNGSIVDLSNIPIPIQTNISSHIITAIAPVNLGTITIPQNSSIGPFPLSSGPNGTTLSIPNAVLSVTSNTSTSNPSKGSLLLSKLGQLTNIGATVAKRNDSSENNDEDDDDDDDDDNDNDNDDDDNDINDGGEDSHIDY